jgi:hypothetical protein
MADINAPFVFDVPGQPMVWDGKPGICVPDLSSNQNALVGWSYQTGFFNWTVTAADNLISPATGTKVELFNTDLGDTIPGAWFAQTEDMTNLPDSQEGAPVCRGKVFKATGLIVIPQLPFTKHLATLATNEPAWLYKDGSNGPGYGSHVVRVTLQRTSVIVKHNNPVVEYPLGSAQFFPGWPSIGNNAPVGNGAISVVAYVPFVVPAIFGSKDDCRQLGITLKLGQQHRIENDATQPIAATEGNLLYVGLTVAVIGKVCNAVEGVQCIAPVAPQPVPPSNNAAAGFARW